MVVVDDVPGNDLLPQQVRQRVCFFRVDEADRRHCLTHCCSNRLILDAMRCHSTMVSE